MIMRLPRARLDRGGGGGAGAAGGGDGVLVAAGVGRPRGMADREGWLAADRVPFGAAGRLTAGRLTAGGLTAGGAAGPGRADD